MKNLGTFIALLASAAGLCAQQYPAGGETVVNNHTLTAQERLAFVRIYGIAPLPGRFWHDSASGLWGAEGRAPTGMLFPGHQYGSLFSPGFGRRYRRLHQRARNQSVGEIVLLGPVRLSGPWPLLAQRLCWNDRPGGISVSSRESVRRLQPEVPSAWRRNVEDWNQWLCVYRRSRKSRDKRRRERTHLDS